MGHSEDSSQGFYPLPQLYATFPKLVRSLFLTSGSFFAVAVTSQWNVLTHKISQHLQWE